MGISFLFYNLHKVILQQLLIYLNLLLHLISMYYTKSNFQVLQKLNWRGKHSTIILSLMTDMMPEMDLQRFYMKTDKHKIYKQFNVIIRENRDRQ